MRNFAVTDNLAVPVDQITGIKVRESYTRPHPWPANLFFDSKEISGRVVIYTEDNRYSIEDPKLAKRFIRSLESSTNIRDAFADDLEREIERCLT